MAGELITDYASEDVILSWNGVPIEAFADTFVTVSYVEDQSATTQTPDGFVANSLLPSTVGTIEVTVQQDSPTNALLTALLGVQKSTRQFQRGTFLISNLNGFSLYTGINAHIQNPPEMTYGKTHEDGLRTWTFIAAELKLAG